MTGTDKLRKAITDGTIKVTIITGPDSGDCPNCPGGNAMIREGECPEGFEPHHFWKLGLSLEACRDCGHSVVAQMNGDVWEMPPA
jgi:1,4-dihydroxy-2-naphthoyl-CoA synthase